MGTSTIVKKKAEKKTDSPHAKHEKHLLEKPKPMKMPKKSGKY